MDFPVSFTEKMKAILGDEFEDFLKGYDRTRHYGLRVNRTKLTAEQFEKMSMYDLKPVPWIDNAFEYEDSVSPAKHPYYFAGMYYLQEPSAMTPANLYQNKSTIWKPPLAVTPTKCTSPAQTPSWSSKIPLPPPTESSSSSATPTPAA